MNERYSHRFHAGNVGDVWKHTVLGSLVAALAAGERPVHVVETHAGAGAYLLGPTGEWTEGVGKLWASPPTAAPAVTRYLERVSAPAGDRRVYPGSPLLTLGLLRPSDRVTLYELEPDTAELLRQSVRGDARATVREGDGLAALAALLADEPEGREVLVVVDPPWTMKEDWTRVPEALVEAWRARPATRFLLWYALKSYTRPNAMIQKLGATGMPAVALELITTPLELQKNRLNGSGILLVGAPEAVLVESLGAAPVLGRLCATHDGRFTVRTVGWSSPWRK